MLMEIPSGGAGPISSAHKTSHEEKVNEARRATKFAGRFFIATGRRKSPG
jgi:hypothetical protein